VNLQIYSITHPRRILGYWVRRRSLQSYKFHAFWHYIGLHTEADSTNMRFRYSDSERGNYSDHEVDYVHPIVTWADVCVAYAAGVINDERNVQQTCWATQRKMQTDAFTSQSSWTNSYSWKTVTANERHRVLLTESGDVKTNISLTKVIKTA